MKTFLLSVALVLLAKAASAGCSGAYKGFFEKRPLAGGVFVPVQTFTIDPATGLIEQCEVANSFDGDFAETRNELRFGYAGRMRELKRATGGTFLTETWQAEFGGVTSAYRIRVETD